MKKNIVSILLVLALIIGMIPSPVYAKTTDSDSSETGEYGSFISGAQVLSDMVKKSGSKVHPRLIMSEKKFADLRSHIGDGTVTAALLEELRGEADRHVSKDPVSVYDADDEDHLLETSKRVQRRVAALALAYNIFGDEKYAERCYKELKAASDFRDWSPSHFLDTAEMCTAFAYGYDWLYNWMTPEKRADLRKAMIEKGLMQVLEDYTDTPSDRQRTYKWYQDTKGDNWQLVCTGGTNLAALAIGDEEDAKAIASQVLTYGYKRAYSFVRRAYSATDGTYIEGLGYWDYATYYLGLQSSALISATGTDYGLADYEGIKKSAEFVRYMSSNTPKSFSFGDDGDGRDTGWAVFLWLGEQLNSPELSAIRLRKIVEDKEFRYLDVLWIDESKQAGSGNNNAVDWGAVGACNASFRDTWDNSGLVTALHVGENCYKYHGHYDLGTFYLESNGSRFFTDLGNESYSLTDRQYSYRIKAEGHNTLVINPTKDIDQREGANCLITEFAGGNEAYAVTDLTDAYGPSGARKVIRGLKMIKDRKCVVVQDEISLYAPGEIYWFAHTTGEIKVASDGRSAVVTVGSDRVWVGLLSEGGTFTVMKAEPLPTSLSVPGAKDNSEYRKLAVHLTNTKDTTISVACIPLKNGETRPSWTPIVKAISEWACKGDANNSIKFTSQPKDVITKTGVALFKVSCVGENLSYQWQWRKGAAYEWADNGLSGCRTNCLSVDAISARNGFQYRCKVTDKTGAAVYSNAATFIYGETANILKNPSDRELSSGIAQFTVKAAGDGLNYLWQWRRNSEYDWATVAFNGYRTATLDVEAITARNGFQYRCKITDKYGKTVYSEPATLRVFSKALITKNPENVIAKGGTVHFSVAAEGTGLSYQWEWRKSASYEWANNGFAGCKTNTLTVEAISARNGFQYRCKVTDKFGTVVYSKPATLFFGEKATITSQPSNVTATVGTTVKFSVGANKSGLTYQWYWRRNSSYEWGVCGFTGARTATMSVDAITARNGYQYRCEVKDKFGNVVYSNVATLTVK